MINVKMRKPIHDRTGKTPAPDSGAESSYSDNEENSYHTESAVPPTTPPTPKRNKRKNERNTIQEENLINQSDNQTAPTANYSYKGKLFSVFIAFAVCPCAYFIIQNLSLSTVSPAKNCSYIELQRQHPQQDEYVWRSLSTGIENILNKRRDSPAVYLFVYEGSNDALKLVRDIAAKVSSCFGKNTQPVEMESNDFTSMSTINDYGYAIEKYKVKLKEGQVFVIANLREIPAAAACALHTICDTYSPVAKDVVIFLTLVIPEIGENPLENAEDALVDLWGSKLDRKDLDALITRVTDQKINFSTHLNFVSKDMET